MKKKKKKKKIILIYDNILPIYCIILPFKYNKYISIKIINIKL